MESQWVSDQQIGFSRAPARVSAANMDWELLVDFAMYLGTGVCLTFLSMGAVVLLVEMDVQLQIALTSWLILLLTNSAMTAHLSWRRSVWELPCLSLRYWYRLMIDACIYVVILLAFCIGALLDELQDAVREDTCRSVMPGVLLPLLILSALEFCMIVAMISEARVRVFPKLLFKRRAGWQKSFGLGLLVGLTLVLALANRRVWLTLYTSVLYMALGLVFIFCLRNAALHGFFVVLAWNFMQQGHCSIWIDLLAPLPTALLILAAGTAETARDTQIIMCGNVVITCAVFVGGVWEDDSFHGLVANAFIGCYIVKQYMYAKRDMGHWASPIGFLKFNTIKRRRQADKQFLMARRQEMDPELFGDPMRAQHIILVSHAWLSTTHADPDGLHLDAMIAKVEERFHVDSSATLWQRLWHALWRYYYIESEGDVLIFFDMSSLYQAPRTFEEKNYFNKALGMMNFMYHSFEVLVIPEIPPSVKYFGHPLAYMDKGWCWAEAEIASIGLQLRCSSEDEITVKLDQDRLFRKSYGISCREALLGVPRYPEELMQEGRELDLISFRKAQEIQGKIFTNGKFDFDRVASILLTVERTQELRRQLEAENLAAVMEIFEDNDLFAMEGEGGLTKQDLANVAFDGEFTTPLHVAVAKGSVELVNFLNSVGARPRRNFSGHLPWERVFFHRISAAARAAQCKPLWSFSDFSSTIMA